MTKLSDDFRQRAKTNAEGSNTLLAAEDFDTSPKKQALAIIGQVNATIYSALADMMDLGTGRHSALADSVSSRLALNSALRTAAAKGEWDEFNRLAGATGVADGGATNGTGAGAGGAT